MEAQIEMFKPSCSGPFLASYQGYFVHCFMKYYDMELYAEVY
jgi:hypothetical protein